MSGNCNQDSDCASGLKCFFRNGCVCSWLSRSGQSGWDYCVDEKFLTRRSKPMVLNVYAKAIVPVILIGASSGLKCSNATDSRPSQGVVVTKRIGLTV